MQNNELYHYGILGMKWGIRKARKNGTTYQYKSMYTKKYEKKAAKLKAGNASKSEIQDAERRAAESQKIDSEMQRIAEKTSVGKGIAHLLLTPTGDIGGSRHYLQTKAISGRDTAVKTHTIRNIGVAAVSSMADILAMPILAPAAYVTNELYTRAERSQAINRAMKKKR